MFKNHSIMWEFLRLQKKSHNPHHILLSFKLTDDIIKIWFLLSGKEKPGYLRTYIIGKKSAKTFIFKYVLWTASIKICRRVIVTDICVKRISWHCIKYKKLSQKILSILLQNGLKFRIFQIVLNNILMCWYNNFRLENVSNVIFRICKDSIALKFFIQ